MTQGSSCISIQCVTKRYRKKDVLKNISLDIKHYLYCINTRDTVIIICNNELQMMQLIPIVVASQIIFLGLFNLETISQWLS